jgi:hypothetical protein
LKYIVNLEEVKGNSKKKVMNFGDLMELGLEVSSEVEFE